MGLSENRVYPKSNGLSLVYHHFPLLHGHEGGYPIFRHMLLVDFNVPFVWFFRCSGGEWYRGGLGQPRCQRGLQTPGPTKEIGCLNGFQ